MQLLADLEFGPLLAYKIFVPWTHFQSGKENGSHLRIIFLNT